MVGPVVLLADGDRTAKERLSFGNGVGVLQQQGQVSQGSASTFPASTRACACEGCALGAFFHPKKRTVVPAWSSRRGSTTIPGVTRSVSGVKGPGVQRRSSPRVHECGARRASWRDKLSP